MSTLYHKRGIKCFTGSVVGDQVTFHTNCDVYPGAVLEIRMSVHQARALAERKPAREILSGSSRETIELFTSGLTPAEFDQLYGGKAKPIDDYPLYKHSGVVALATVKASGPGRIEAEELPGLL